MIFIGVVPFNVQVILLSIQLSCKYVSYEAVTQIIRGSTRLTLMVGKIGTPLPN